MLSHRNNEGKTPLLCAAQNGNLVLIKSLFNAQASLHDVDNDAYSCAHLACEKGPKMCVAVFFSFGLY